MDKTLFLKAAEHEASHAVMRKLLGLSATKIVAQADGEGMCHGSGRVIGPDLAVFISLAGTAYELGFDPKKALFFDFERLAMSPTPADGIDSDYIAAWKILDRNVLLRIRVYAEGGCEIQSTKIAFWAYLSQACQMLKPRIKDIRLLGGALVANGGEMSPQMVARRLRGVGYHGDRSVWKITNRDE